MKKLSKVVLAASMFAALFAGCSNGGLVANDVLDAPELEGYVTENGVAVVYWQPVKDVASYTTYVKKPGTEEWQYFTSDTSNLDARKCVCMEVDKLDTEYEFKVVATSNKVNVLASEETITLETPEAWVDTAAISASSITLTLVGNTANKYKLEFPMPAGFTYQYKLVNCTTDATADAKDLWFSYASDISSFDDPYDPINYHYWLRSGEEIKVYDDDDNELPSYADTLTVPDDDAEYRVVVQMKPRNAEVATTKYILSSATVKYDSSDYVYRPMNPYIENTSTIKKVLHFTAMRYNGTVMPATSYRIYQKLETYNYNSDGISTGSSVELKELGNPSLTEKDDTYKPDESETIKYEYKVTLEESTSKVVYGYTFYVVYTNENGDSVWYQFN